MERQEELAPRLVAKIVGERIFTLTGDDRVARALDRLVHVLLSDLDPAADAEFLADVCAYLRGRVTDPHVVLFPTSADLMQAVVRHSFESLEQGLP